MLGASGDLMHRESSRYGEPWSLREGFSTVRIHRRGDLTDQEAERGVAPALLPFRLEQWLRSSPALLRSIYEGLGWRWPWMLTSLERSEHGQRVVNRLMEAFESGALVVIIEAPRLADQRFEHEEPAQVDPAEWTPPPREQPKPLTPASNLDAAAQAQTLRDAARDGVPFCEECEKNKQQRAAA
jgi:hypothetical protein